MTGPANIRPPAMKTGPTIVNRFVAPASIDRTPSPKYERVEHDFGKVAGRRIALEMDVQPTPRRRWWVSAALIVALIAVALMEWVPVLADAVFPK